MPSAAPCKMRCVKTLMMRERVKLSRTKKVAIAATECSEVVVVQGTDPLWILPVLYFRDRSLRYIFLVVW